VIEPLICRVGLVCVLIVACGAVHAEAAYVTDRLQLGVHPLPDASGKAFAKIKSGERVQVLEENQYHALVTIPDGRKGWVKKTYLVTEKPAIVRVAEVEKDRDRAVAKLESLTSSLGDREARVSEIEAQIAAREARGIADADELKRLRVETSELSDRLAAYEFSVPGTLFFLAIAASLMTGILAAWWWFDHSSRVRHGGFRIH